MYNIPMIAALIIFAFVFLVLFWSVSLIFYKEREGRELKSAEEKCFTKRSRSIIYENGNDKAVLFTHGFPTTPYMYAYPAKEFSKRGYDVYAPLIPTFGSDYKEFEETTFSDWFLFMDEYYVALRKRYKEVYLVGVSMGGAISLKLSEKYSDSPLSPKRIAILSAPVTYNSLIRDGIVTSWPVYLARIVAIFTKEINPSCIDGKKNGEDGDENWVGYGGTFPRQGLSLIYNLKTIRAELGKITVPIISIHDKGDKTVPFKNQKIIIDAVSSEEKVVISERMPPYRHSHHSLLMYNSTKEKYTNALLEFFAR